MLGHLVIADDVARFLTPMVLERAAIVSLFVSVKTGLRRVRSRVRRESGRTRLRRRYLDLLLSGSLRGAFLTCGIEH